MLTRERFATLVAELRGTEPLDRARILARPEAAQPLTLAQASELTGLSESTLKQYALPSRRDGHSNPLPPGPPWQAGDLAAWAADRPYQDRKLKTPPRPARTREPAVPRFSNEDILPAVRAILDAERDARPPMDATALKRYLEERAGITVAWERARELYIAARGPLPQPPPSKRDDGLITATELAEAFGVGVDAISHAVRRGRLTARKREPRNGSPPLVLFDPQKVRHPGGPTRTPVDIKDSNEERP